VTRVIPGAPLAGRQEPVNCLAVPGLAEAEQDAEEDGLPLPPKPTRIRRPDEPLTPEEAELRERLQRQVLDGAD